MICANTDYYANTLATITIKKEKKKKLALPP